MSKLPAVQGKAESAKSEVDADLPEQRRAVVEQGLAQYQRMAADLDALNRENSALKVELTATRVERDALQSLLNDWESRLHSAYAVRDEAVGHRAVYESLFASVKA